jgi:2-polyprenyl-6-methoxyphenol hydroxylase-like FAD-dependent oxidoreductase
MLPAVENSPRAAVYMPVAVRELDRAGILGDCRKIGFSGTKLTWRKITGEVIASLERVPDDDEPYENLVLGQHELAEVIQTAFQQESSSDGGMLARVLFNHRAIKIEQDKEGVTVTAEVGEEKREQKFRAQYVVGADGAKSFVRRHLDIAFEGFTWDRQIVATNVVYPFEKYGYTPGNNIVYVLLNTLGS